MAMFGLTGRKAQETASKMAYAALKGSYGIWVSRCKDKWKYRPPRHVRNAPR
jgi:hypothetical protein